MIKEILVNVAGDRLDRFVADKIDESRERVSNLIKDGHILVNKQVKKVSYKVSEGDLISVTIPEPVSLDIEEENIRLNIIYEDDDIAAINKPKGMIVHPSGNIVTGTLVNALLFHFDKLSEINGVYRPGIVHRLDKDTSGLLLVA
ncbi:MAG: RluA family pseudouridine synthase, partial [Tissierellia bacterium]|nr:RluA family pseudouridine synthase [Tissierellia bacterium]